MMDNYILLEVVHKNKPNMNKMGITIDINNYSTRSSSVTKKSYTSLINTFPRENDTFMQWFLTETSDHMVHNRRVCMPWQRSIHLPIYSPMTSFITR